MQGKPVYSGDFKKDGSPKELYTKISTGNWSRFTDSAEVLDDIWKPWVMLIRQEAAEVNAKKQDAVLDPEKFMNDTEKSNACIYTAFDVALRKYLINQITYDTVHLFEKTSMARKVGTFMSTKGGIPEGSRPYEGEDVQGYQRRMETKNGGKDLLEKALVLNPINGTAHALLGLYYQYATDERANIDNKRVRDVKALSHYMQAELLGGVGALQQVINGKSTHADSGKDFSYQPEFTALKAKVMKEQGAAAVTRAESISKSKTEEAILKAAASCAEKEIEVVSPPQSRALGYQDGGHGLNNNNNDVPADPFTQLATRRRKPVTPGGFAAAEEARKSPETSKKTGEAIKGLGW